MLLFIIDEKESIIIHPEAVKLFPEFRKLKEYEVMYMIYAYDYFSPYRRFNERDRKLKAGRRALPKTIDIDILESKKYMADAIKIYKSLQYNPIQDRLRNYKLKYDLLQQEFISETSPANIKKLSETIDHIESKIQELEYGIAIDEIKQLS